MTVLRAKWVDSDYFVLSEVERDKNNGYGGDNPESKLDDKKKEPRYLTVGGDLTRHTGKPEGNLEEAMKFTDVNQVEGVLPYGFHVVNLGSIMFNRPEPSE